MPNIKFPKHKENYIDKLAEKKNRNLLAYLYWHFVQNSPL